jgi:WD40 repeat protein
LIESEKKATNATLLAEVEKENAEFQTKEANREKANAEKAKAEAQLNERNRARLLFDSEFTRARVLIKNGEYQEAAEALMNSYGSEKEASAERKRARDLLVWFVKEMSPSAAVTNLQAGSLLSDIAINSKGNYLTAVGEAGTVALFDLGSKRLVNQKSAGRGRIEKVTFGPTGDWLITAGEDRVIQRWSLPDLTKVERPVSGSVQAIAVSPDGKLLASAGPEMRLMFWDLPDFKERTSIPLDLPGNIISLAFSKNGKFLAAGSAEGAVWLCDLQGRRLLNFAPRPTQFQTAPANQILRLAFDSFSEKLAAAGSDGRVYLWNLASQETSQVFRGHKNAVLALSFLDEGRTLASAGRDRTIRLWDCRTLGLPKCSYHRRFARA